ncbi:unnamed protein product, partial [Symbiodinium necroappetens]
MGCCGRACGWNGRACLRWPFLAQGDRVTWQEQCCAEKNILVGSQRELMCNSVLGAAARKQLSEAHVDLPLAANEMGLPMTVGQDEKLFWTGEGAKSELGKLGWAKEHGQVYDSFLSWQPLSVIEGILLGYWMPKKILGAQSLAQ